MNQKLIDILLANGFHPPKDGCGGHDTYWLNCSDLFKKSEYYELHRKDVENCPVEKTDSFIKRIEIQMNNELEMRGSNSKFIIYNS